MVMNTPVLLITFNRPMHTRKVLEVVLRQNPSALYVFQDGARKNNDTDLVKCNEVRGVIDELTQNIDFQVYKFYSDKNLGCGPGPSMESFLRMMPFRIPIFFRIVRNFL